VVAQPDFERHTASMARSCAPPTQI
jgi:hypothetical protein